MIDRPEFSAAGDRPTAFEVDVLARTTVEGDLVLLGKRLMQELGAEAGAAALAILLEELGEAKVTIPQRKGFWPRLWRQERRDLVLALSARPDWSDRDIATHLCTTVDVVRQIRCRDRRGYRVTSAGR